MNRHTMEENLGVVDSHFRSETANEIEKALHLYTDDVVWESPARGVVLRGKSAAAENYHKMFASMDDLKVTQLRRFAREECVVDDSVATFRLVGDGVVNPPLPVGTKVESRMVHMFDMRGNKIARETVYEMWRNAASGSWAAVTGTVPAAVQPLEAAAERIMQISFGFWSSKTLLSAVELGVFTELAQGSLTEALRTGLPQNEASNGGGNQFEILYSDPSRLRGFLQGMTGLSMGTSRAIAQKFPWHQYKTFVDVGTAQGATPVQIALAHPHLTGTGFDLPPVGPIFEEYVQSFGLGERIRFQAGDFIADPLPSADVLLMGHILHDWNLNEKKMLIAKTHAALPEGGAFVAFEGLIDDDRRQNASGLLMSLNMLIETPGGFDFTGADCSSWMREAGFRATWVEYLDGPNSMVVGIK